MKEYHIDRFINPVLANYQKKKKKEHRKQQEFWENTFNQLHDLFFLFKYSYERYFIFF